MTLYKRRKRDASEDGQVISSHKVKTMLSLLEELMIVMHSKGYLIDILENVLILSTPKGNRMNIYQRLKEKGVFEKERGKEGKEG